jgi:hypothetical protein
MTVSSQTTITTSPAERFTDWAVAALAIIALLAGWVFKTSVENRSITLQVAGISAQTPQGWLQVSTQGNEILHVSDPSSSAFGTTYIIQNIPVEAGSAVGQTASLLTLQRGQQLTAFRVLEQKNVTVYGKPAYELSYVFVESDPNLTKAQIPNIVLGLDYIYLTGDHAVVVTYWADKENFELDLGRFQLFLKSLKY